MQTNAARFGGCSVDRTEDSVTALFDGPARAIRCGHAIGGMAAAQGLPLRIGVHTGECDLVAGVGHGLAAQISSRIAQLAQPGEVLVDRGGRTQQPGICRMILSQSGCAVSEPCRPSCDVHSTSRLRFCSCWCWSITSSRTPANSGGLPLEAWLTNHAG